MQHNASSSFSVPASLSDSLKRGWHYLILTRLYAWIDVAATGVAGYFVGSSTHDWSTALIVVVPISLLLWMTLNWVSESRQRDEGRTPPPQWLIAVVMLIAVGLIGAINTMALWPTALYLILIWIYPFKKTVQGLATVCWAIRGCHTAVHFLIAVLLGAPALGGDAWCLAFGLGLLQASRSLVAEIRDAPYDKFGLVSEITRFHSPMKAQWISFVIAAGLAISAIFFLNREAAIVIGFFFLTCAYLMVRYSKSLPVAAYHIHCLFFTCCVAVKGLIDFSPPLWSVWATVIVSLIVVYKAYHSIFRPINRDVALGFSKAGTNYSTAVPHGKLQQKRTYKHQLMKPKSKSNLNNEGIQSPRI